MRATYDALWHSAAFSMVCFILKKFSAGLSIATIAVPLVISSLPFSAAVTSGGTYACQAGSETVNSGTLPGLLFNTFYVDLQPGVWPVKYKKNMECTFTMNAPAGMQMYVEMPLCVLPDTSSTFCSGDRLDVKAASYDTNGNVVATPHTVHSICYDPALDNGGTYTYSQGVEIKFYSDGVDDLVSSGCLGMMFAHNITEVINLIPGLDFGGGGTDSGKSTAPVSAAVLSLLRQYALITDQAGRDAHVCSAYDLLHPYFPNVVCN